MLDMGMGLGLTSQSEVAGVIAADNPLFYGAPSREPSFASGYARSASVALHPNLHNGLVCGFSAALGKTGGTLRTIGRMKSVPIVNLDGWGPSYLQFDASSSYLNFGDLSAHFSTKATMVCHLRLNTDPPASVDQQGIIKFGTGPSDSYPGTPGTIYLGAFRNDRPYLAHGLLSDLTQWHQLAITANPSDWNVYQNTALAYNTAGDPQIYLPAASEFGRSSVTSWRFDGDLRAMWLYSRVLSIAELQHLRIDPEAPLRLGPTIYGA